MPYLNGGKRAAVHIAGRRLESGLVRLAPGGAQVPYLNGGLSKIFGQEESTMVSRIARMFCLLLTSIFVISSFAPQQANTAPIPENFYSAMQWRCIGPHRGGRVLAVSGVRGEPETFYFGAVGGGVWKTTDAGQAWTPIFDSQPIASIGALAVSESNSNVIYVGTGEADMRSDISVGKGVYKSTDAGLSWSYLGLGDTRQIGRILVN
nr:hypothetical protein [Acidobacteriota bacterium]